MQNNITVKCISNSSVLLKALLQWSSNKILLMLELTKLSYKLPARFINALLNSMNVTLRRTYY